MHSMMVLTFHTGTKVSYSNRGERSECYIGEVRGQYADGLISN